MLNYRRNIFKKHILGGLQRCALFFGIFARKASKPDVSNLKKFLNSKSCGIELLMIGDGRDGTYVIPKDMEGILYCFSPGVGPSVQFEEMLYENFGIRSILIDASIDTPPTKRTDFFSFQKKFLGAVTSNDYISLDDWVKSHTLNNTEADLILQMDIEGGELSSLLSCSEETLRRFKVICLEIHFLDTIYLDFFHNTLEQTILKLQEHFSTCYVRANDCCGHFKISGEYFPRIAEVTLIRKDRIKEAAETKKQKFHIKNV